MKRTTSPLAQLCFATVNRLSFASRHAHVPWRYCAAAANKIANALAKYLGKDHLVSAHIYGHKLLMPAEHPLAVTLAVFPRYNRPLALAAQAIMDSSSPRARLVVIDVGANVGETIAIIEQQCPGVGEYLCIEPDREIAEICRINHRENARVEIRQCFIGEEEGLEVQLEDDGRANPSTRLVNGSTSQKQGGAGHLVKLDSAAASFVNNFGALSLLKIDTEGFDFSVMRSASALITQYKPVIFFEWYPKLLAQQGEQLDAGFKHLGNLGYCHFVFFTSQGDYYCCSTTPEDLLICSLAANLMRDGSVEYYDVVAITNASIYKRLVESTVQ